MNELANFLTNLTTTTLNLTTNLAYGYGDLATKEINSLRDLLSEAEEMIPIIETEACMAEVEELNREDQLFNYWMTMLYGNGNVVSPVEAHRSSKANRLERRKQNKKHHKADRKHGKNYLKRNNLQELSVENAEFFHNKKAMDIAYDDGKWIYTGKDGNNFWSKVWYTRHKKNRNNRLDSAMKAREEEYITEF